MIMLVTVLHKTFSIITCRWTISVNQFHVHRNNPGCGRPICLISFQIRQGGKTKYGWKTTVDGSSHIFHFRQVSCGYLQWICVQLFLQFDCVYKSLLDDPNILEIVFDDADEMTKTFLLTLQVLHAIFKQTQRLTTVTNLHKKRSRRDRN